MKPYLWTDEDITPALHLLRATFPHWGFLYDPFAYRWIALRGRRPPLSADTPEDLAAHISNREPHPDQTTNQPTNPLG